MEVSSSARLTPRPFPPATKDIEQYRATLVFHWDAKKDTVLFPHQGEATVSVKRQKSVTNNNAKGKKANKDYTQIGKPY